MRFAEDKQKHFVVSTAIGSAARMATGDNTTAMAVGVGVGLAKEISDAHSKTNCASVQDLAYDALGAALGVYGTNWVIRHNFIGYSTAF